MIKAIGRWPLELLRRLYSHADPSLRFRWHVEAITKIAIVNSQQSEQTLCSGLTQTVCSTTSMRLIQSPAQWYLYNAQEYAAP
jgi:hypothetical protein